jgi:tetratricopeptide (TPR) repeat protein
LLADFGDALRTSGDTKRAGELYQGLLAWHPRAAQKDRAYAGLGLIAVGEEKEKAALDWFALFEKEASQSPLRSQVLSSRAELLYKRKQYSEAIAQLEEILKIPSAKGIKWVEALYRIGEIYVESGEPKKATAYFERIYMLYGRWTDYVAKAYWQRGQALEKIGELQKARETYEACVADSSLAATPEYARARERLKTIGGGS